jgi:hypothetical protein
MNGLKDLYRRVMPAHEMTDPLAYLKRKDAESEKARGHANSRTAAVGRYTRRTI